jgi:hypothetical protein
MTCGFACFLSLSPFLLLLFPNGRWCAMKCAASGGKGGIIMSSGGPLGGGGGGGGSGMGHMCIVMVQSGWIIVSQI